MNKTPSIAALALALGLATSAGAAALVSVPATSNPWLAGMPPGTNAGSGDSAPGQSPAQVTGIAVTPGGALRFSSVGATDHCDGGGCGLAGAEGDALEAATLHAGGAQFGISDVLSPIDALIGVFLSDDQPSLNGAPAALSFGTPAARDFSILSPLLQQAFFIGDGMRNDGLTLQSFVVPAGATRLFLGTMDGFGWFNNVGGLRVTIESAAVGVPEPASWLLLLAGAAAWRRGRTRRG